MSTLAEVARDLDLGAFVKLGRGEEGTGGRDKPSILADTLEAVIGATYIDCGLESASDLVHRLFDQVIERSALLGAGLDWKTSLQELTADRGLGVPEYHVRDSGPDHQKLFRAAVKVGSRELGSGEGRSKKAAEQLAAEAAYRTITAETPEKGPPPATAPPATAPANGISPATPTGKGQPPAETSALRSSVPPQLGSANSAPGQVAATPATPDA
jgi:ribonuclease III